MRLGSNKLFLSIATIWGIGTISITYIETAFAEQPILQNNQNISRSINSQSNSIASENLNKSIVYVLRGTERYNLGDHLGAIGDLNQAIKLNPKSVDAYHKRSFIRYELGDFQGAIDDCNKAIQITPHFAPAYYNRSAAKRQLGDEQGANNDYKKALQLDASSK